MGIKGFKIGASTVPYDYNYLENKPDILTAEDVQAQIDGSGHATPADLNNLRQEMEEYVADYVADYITPEVPATGISLNQNTLSIGVRETLTLTATKTPANSDQRILWRSSNSAVASVNRHGAVTGVSEGSATITASAGDQTAQCTVTSAHIDATAVAVSPATVSVEAFQTAQLSAVLTPANASRPVTWTSSDPTIATVDENGLVTAVAEGTATITASCSGVTGSCAVTVTAYTALAITEFTESSDLVRVGTVDWDAGDYVELVVDMSTCAADTKDNVLYIGKEANADTRWTEMSPALYIMKSAANRLRIETCVPFENGAADRFTQAEAYCNYYTTPGGDLTFIIQKGLAYSNKNSGNDTQFCHFIGAGRNGWLPGPDVNSTTSGVDGFSTSTNNNALNSASGTNPVEFRTGWYTKFFQNKQDIFVGYGVDGAPTAATLKSIKVMRRAIPAAS